MKRVALIAVLGVTFACSNDPGDTEPPIREEVDRVEILEDPVLTPDAFITQDEAALIGVEVFDDSLVFIYDGEPVAYPAVGNVVTGVEGGGFIRRILSADLDGNRLTCATQHAYLDEFFEELAFRTTFRPAPDFVRDEAGRRVDALSAGLSFPSFDINEACGITGGAAVELEIDIDPVFNMEIDLGDELFRSEVGGDLEGEIKASLGGVSFDCEWEIPRDRRPSREWTQTFFVPVGFIPIPVVITHELFLTAKLEAGASATAGTVEASAGGSIGFSAGVEHTERGGWRNISEGRASGSAGLEATEPGTVSVSAKFSPGFGYLGKVYDTAGPEIRLSGWIQGEVTLLWCDWEAEVTGGVTAQVGAKLEVPVWDRVLFEYVADLDIVDGRTIYATEGVLPLPICEEEEDPRPEPDPDDPATDPTSCRSTGCNPGEVCDAPSGACSADSCETTMCAADEACRAGSGCETSCASVTCGEGERCSAGMCETDMCVGVTCGGEQVCNPADGSCRNDPCDAVTCGLAETCNSESGACEPEDPCVGLTCPEGETCMEGECAVDLCAGIACEEGQVCNADNGECETDPCGGMCGEGEECNADSGECEAEEEDPCASVGMDCNECNRTAGCGWCEGGGGCMSNDREAECGADNWRDSPSACPACGGASSCGDCTTTPGLAGYCVWCAGRCVNQSTTEFEVCGGEFIAVPGSCGG